MRQEPYDSKSSDNSELAFERALLKAEEEFRQAVRAVFLEEHNAKKDINIIRALGTSKPWLSAVINKPRKVQKLQIERLLTAIKKDKNRRLLLDAWQAVIDPLRPGTSDQLVSLKPEEIFRLAQKCFRGHRADLGLDLLLPIKLRKFHTKMAEELLVAQCLFGFHLRENPVSWNSITTLIELSEERSAMHLRARAYRLKAHMLRNHYTLPMSKRSLDLARSNLDSLGSSIEVSKTRGEISQERERQLRFHLIKESLLLQALFCTENTEQLNIHMAGQIDSLDRFLDKDSDELWHTSVYELKARIWLAVGNVRKAEQILLDHLDVNSQRWTEIETRYKLMSIKLLRAKEQREEAIAMAELLMRETQAQRDLFHHDQALREWNILRNLEFPPSRPVF